MVGDCVSFSSVPEVMSFNGGLLPCGNMLTLTERTHIHLESCLLFSFNEIIEFHFKFHLSHSEVDMLMCFRL